jgi:ribose/xylose/arabinose/galactoside ABC-type transport system permease subunit
MSQLATASGSVSPIDAKERALLRNNKYITTIVLAVFTGIFCLVFFEQIAAGWVAFGERANISRRDLNLVEIGLLIAALLWGALCLYTALGWFRHSAAPAYTDYLSGQVGRVSPGVLLSIAFLAALAAITALIAVQILTGWLALGERANISRRDINLVEWAVVIFCAIWSFASVRTLLALWKRDPRSWPWLQWIALIASVLSLIALYAGIVSVHEVLPAGGTVLDNLPGLLEVIGPGLILALSAIVVYRYSTIAVDLTADQSVRNRLAKSPGAGAIIGLAAVLIGFSIASSLFLEPRALAGALSTNVTNGIVAIGITLLMISGEFDLSVGSIFGASALIFILAMTEGVLGLPPVNAVLAAIISLAFAGLLGLINGILLIRTGIPSFIVTLGTLLAFRAIPLVLVPEGRIIRYADYGIEQPIITFSPFVLIALLLALLVVVAFTALRQLPKQWGHVANRIRTFGENTNAFRDIALAASTLWAAIVTIAIVAVGALSVLGVVDLLGRTGTLIPISFFDLANGRIESLPLIGPLTADINLRMGVFWWFLLVILFQFVLSQLRYGGFSFAVGGNPGAARAQGISVNRVKVLNFVICAMLCGVAGITFVSRVGSVNATLGEGLELEVIAASVIGGVLLTGGYGSIVGALLGVLIFGLLRTGLVLVGMDPRVFFGVQGVIIIVAVVINTAVRRVRT